eukprot:TRINITY_DN6931_c0_g2_i1.p1 TRINITY_DN6931_c0_g2~~TRINITY_DN6931_c0_g2_i1.p1  ORF type:complete len:346 (-),score=56.42 TRINITY_DN6931_c0_g2_i1:456-1493(-)
MPMKMLMYSALAALGAPQVLADDAVLRTTPLSQWAMIEAHDSATGYLKGGDLFHPVNTWAITQPSNLTAAITMQLNCGARAFDLRAKVDPKGRLVFHHGSIEVMHPLVDVVQEFVNWAAENTADEDFLLAEVKHCDGNNCTEMTVEAFAAAGVQVVTDCTSLQGKTLGDALELSRLPRGGHLLVTMGCVDGDYNPSINCWGVGKLDIEYSCHQDGHDKAVPWEKMWQYLDNTSTAGIPRRGRKPLWAMQALWQESASTIVIGELHLSSLLKDEQKSGLNRAVASAIRSGRFPHINLLEVNNVCDGGPELLQALRARRRDFARPALAVGSSRPEEALPSLESLNLI